MASHADIKEAAYMLRVAYKDNPAKRDCITAGLKRYYASVKSAHTREKNLATRVMDLPTAKYEEAVTKLAINKRRTLNRAGARLKHTILKHIPRKEFDKAIEDVTKKSSTEPDDESTETSSSDTDVSSSSESAQSA